MPVRLRLRAPTIRVFGAIVALALLLLSQAPLAQSAAEPIRVYPSSYFASFSPRTALDMVEKIPGFSIKSSDDDRGLGQASGNVLINGKRSFGKNYDAEDTLESILAASVQKLELYEGAKLGIPGLSGVVVNVVVETARFEGGWQWLQIHRSRIDSVWADLALNASGQFEDLNWTLAIANEPRRFGDWGEETIRANGELEETREEIAKFHLDMFEVSGNLNWASDTGRSANLGFSLGIEEENARERSLRRPVVGPERQRDFDERFDGIEGEISADLEIPFGAQRIKTVFYQSLESQSAVSTAHDFDAGKALLSREKFDLKLDFSETVLRTELIFGANAAWNLSLEAARNTLDSDAALFQAAFADELASQVLGNPDCQIEERRGETNLTYAGQLSAKLGLQASLGAEYSEIEQSGSFSSAREFTRPKGLLALSYRAFDTSNVSFRLERQVGQLQFDDFCSTVQLSDGSVVSGNPELVPERSWRTELEWEQRLGTSAFALNLWFEKIDDVVDRIPIGEADAVGNIDTGERFGVDLSSTWRLEPLGWQGARFTWEISLQRGEVEDPVTGVSRRFSDEFIREIDAELRHDIPGSHWAWGVQYNSELFAPQYRLDQIRIRSRSAGFWRIFVENKNFFGLRARLVWRNVGDRKNLFSRQVFDGRRDAELLFTENRVREFGHIFRFELSGSF